jgi:competence ComEA-like helix-hairpin-helix protein
LHGRLSAVARNPLKSYLGCIILCCASAAGSAACVKLPRRAQAHAAQAPARAEGFARVPLNRASREELEALPGIGPALAARIVEQRERYGPFRRAEHLMLVRGVSERRFRQLRPFVSAE